METHDGFEADAEEHQVDLILVEGIREKYNHVQSLAFRTSFTNKENWNELWEKNVAPVYVDDQCLIRAEFHPSEKKYPYEIVITPKMSFGTGHHPTTHLMIKAMLAVDHHGKQVMDAGCGTAILSIFAALKGAAVVEAFDIDEWSITNGEENARLNNVPNVRVRRGTIADFFWPHKFDIILANINRNILLAEMAAYSQCLVSGGILLLSGFYVRDIPDLVATANNHQLSLEFQEEREQWATLRLRKSDN